MSHYLIEFRFFGKAKYEIKQLIRDVDHRFHLRRSHKVPHISLAGPFTTNDERRLVSDFKRICSNQDIMHFEVDGFDTFENNGVVFIDIKPDKNLDEFRWQLSKTLQPYCNLGSYDYKKEFEYHATIAMKLNNDKFKAIKSYINSKPKPKFKHILARVTLIKNRLILCEYDFLLKRLLIRKEAKSDEVLKKTFSLIHEKISQSQKSITKHKQGKCDYHLCSKDAELTRCDYCDNYFCKEHTNPKPPTMPRFKSTEMKDRILMEEWHKPGGHPCPPYYDVWLEEKEKDSNKWGEFLNKFLGKKPEEINIAPEDTSIKSPENLTETPSIFSPRVYLISDLHLDHTNIIKYCKRPFKDVQEMNYVLVNNWNKTIRKNDIVYFLGDLAFGTGNRGTDYWLERLNGNITFIKGNHDVSKKINLNEKYEFEYNHKKFLLVHDPKDVPKDWKDWVICGHHHNNYPKEYPFIDGNKKRINVGVELIDYKPLNIVDLFSINFENIEFMETINSKPILKKKGDDEYIDIPTDKPRKPIEINFKGVIIIAIIFAFLFYLLLHSLSSTEKQQIPDLVIEENNSNISPIQKICSNNLSEQQLSKAKLLTQEAQIKEFGCAILTQQEIPIKKEVVIQTKPQNKLSIFVDWVKGLFNHIIISGVSCTDGTLSYDCSLDKPYYCNNGTLIKKSSKCGCPYDYKEDREGCIKIQRCSDGTAYGECSSNKPYYCKIGNLIKDVDLCGCPFSLYNDGSDCVKKEMVIEKAIFKYTNVERAANSVPLLVYDDSLSIIAREHSQDMADNHFFKHDNLQGESPTERAARYGYPLHKELGDGWYSEGIAENIGTMSSGDIVGIGYVSSDPDSIAKAQVKAWMGSSGHRANILNPEYIKLGVGTAYDGNTYKSTQDFW